MSITLCMPGALVNLKQRNNIAAPCKEMRNSIVLACPWFIKACQIHLKGANDNSGMLLICRMQN